MTTRLKEKSLKTYYDNFVNKYEFLGKVGEGAYGIVRRACEKTNPNQHVAIKSFKLKITREGEGVPVTVCREINLLRELDHENILRVRDVALDPEHNSLVMVFDFCKLDLEKLLKYHQRAETYKLPSRLDISVVKSMLWQILRGVHYLHSNWIIHRDMKPANILVNDEENERGTIKIADFGLARVFQDPLRRLGDDGPVVTIWYRAPELLLGSRHYTPAIDIWAVGCIFHELLTLKPLFEGKEIKVENNQNPFQKHQLETIFNILGTPTLEQWPTMKHLPEYKRLDMKPVPSKLEQYTPQLDPKKPGFDLLKRLLEYDPSKRITAEEALRHPFFEEQPKPSLQAFAGPLQKKYMYPDNHDKTHQQNQYNAQLAAQQHHAQHGSYYPPGAQPFAHVGAGGRPPLAPPAGMPQGQAAQLGTQRQAPSSQQYKLPYAPLTSSSTSARTAAPQQLPQAAAQQPQVPPTGVPGAAPNAKKRTASSVANPANPTQRAAKRQKK